MTSYTLVLTRGTHVVTPETGAAILSALETGARTVEADVDILGDGTIRPGVSIVTAHIIALIPNHDIEQADDYIFGSKVTALPSRSIR